MLTARRFSEFNTSVICHAVLILCLGSFLLVARYVLRLKALALKGRRFKYFVKIMLTLVLYWLYYIVTPGPDVSFELQAQSVNSDSVAS